MAGVEGAANMPAYSASKGAVMSLTRAASKDFAPLGIRVNAISPAFIGPGRMWDRQTVRQAEAATQYYSTDPAEVERQMIGAVPLRRVGPLDEVANTVVWLLSDESSYLTGPEPRHQRRHLNRVTCAACLCLPVHGSARVDPGQRRVR